MASSKGDLGQVSANAGRLWASGADGWTDITPIDRPRQQRRWRAAVVKMIARLLRVEVAIGRRSTLATNAWGDARDALMESGWREVPMGSPYRIEKPPMYVSPARTDALSEPPGSE